MRYYYVTVTGGVREGKQYEIRVSSIGSSRAVGGIPGLDGTYHQCDDLQAIELYLVYANVRQYTVKEIKFGI